MKKTIILIACVIAAMGIATTVYATSSNTESQQVSIKTKCSQCDGKGYKIIKKKCTCQGHGCGKCDYKGWIEVGRMDCSNCEDGWVRKR